MANWKTILLVGSLGLNLIGIGAIVGAKWRHGGFGHHGVSHRGFGDVDKRIARLTKTLPESKRADVASLLRDYFGFKKQNHKAMREAGHHLRTILKTDPFDEKQFEEAHKAMARMRNEHMDKRFELTKKLAHMLNKEERHKLLRRLRGKHRGRRFGHKGHHERSKDKPRD